MRSLCVYEDFLRLPNIEKSSKYKANKAEYFLTKIFEITGNSSYECLNIYLKWSNYLIPKFWEPRDQHLPVHRIVINRRVTWVGSFCVPTHVALCMFIMQVLASQLLFLANRNTGQAIPPLFWPFNWIKSGGHVALLSDPIVNCLYCEQLLWPESLPPARSVKKRALVRGRRGNILRENQGES